MNVGNSPDTHAIDVTVAALQQMQANKRQAHIL
jgi:hypothetical protein